LIMKGKLSLILLIVIVIASCQSQTDGKGYYYPDADTSLLVSSDLVNERSLLPAHFGFGRKANTEDIHALDIDISPDGKGLPEGEGDTYAGRLVYTAKCSGCHGANGEGGNSSRLVGIPGDTIKVKTIGNYWPYATTLFDYIRRAMPYNAPGSLPNDEVYDLTAYLLYRNMIIDSATILTRKNLPKLVMPAKALFVNDDRKGGPEIK
jgi:S-disulfanyl-L-cysteine oxidoreductase SoxD